jgi:aminobenzoyl-glutamate transport protein
MSGVTAGVAGSQGGEGKGVMQRALDMIERVGNKVPNPVLMFLYLILLVIILSTILA